MKRIRNSVQTFEYDDELVIVMDFGGVSDASLKADIVGGELIVSYTNSNRQNQDIEFSLPEEFKDPDVKINNGVVTITQPLGETDGEDSEEEEVSDTDESGDVDSEDSE